MLADQIGDEFPSDKKLLRLELREYHQLSTVPSAVHLYSVPVSLYCLNLPVFQTTISDALPPTRPDRMEAITIGNGLTGCRL